MATTNKSLRMHASRDGGRARDYLFHSYLAAMTNALRMGDGATYTKERAALIELFEDTNNRLIETEGAWMPPRTNGSKH